MVRVANGHPLMALVTGTGCTASALVGAFSAVNRDPLRAAAGALAFMGLAGETAARKTKAPGSFQTALLDAFHEITPEMLESGAEVSVES